MAHHLDRIGQRCARRHVHIFTGPAHGHLHRLRVGGVDHALGIP